MFGRERSSRTRLTAAVGAVALTAGFLTVGLTPTANAGEMTWQRTNVDSSSPGWYSSLVLDDDVPHVAYRDQQTSMNFAWYDGSNWVGEGGTEASKTVFSGATTGVPSLALDAAGVPHIAFGTPGAVYVASWNADTKLWDRATVHSAAGHFVGMFPSLAFDKDGKAHLSYIDCASGAYRDCSSGGALMYASADADGTWSAPTVVDAVSTTAPTFSADSYTSLALTSDNQPRIAYYNESGNYAKYAVYSGGWTTDRLSTSSTTWLSGGRNLSLALDSADVPHVAYESGGVRYTSKSGAYWTNGADASVDGVASGVPSQNSLALEADGTPHVAYRKPTRVTIDGVNYDRTRVLHAVWTGSAWSTETVSDVTLPTDPALPGVTDNLWYPSLALDGTGSPAVTYYVQLGGTRTDAQIVYAHKVPAHVLTVTADSQSIAYGEEPGTPTFTYAGFQDGDDESVIDKAPTCSIADGPYTPGEYKITCTGAEDDKYSFEYVDAKLTVGKATLTLTADNQQIDYGDQPAEPTFSYTGFIGQDTAADIDTAPTCTIADGPYVPGDYAITCQDAADNYYDFKYVDGTLSVGKATLKVTAADESITYGEQPGELTYSYDGFMGNDGPADIDKAPTCTVADGPYTPGEYTISCAGAEDDKYAFDYVNGKLTVAKATLTVTAGNQQIKYGEQPAEPTFSYDGFIGQDTAADIDTAPTCTIADGPYLPGDYAITCQDAADNYYDFKYVDGTLSVGKATLKVTAADESITYGQQPGELTYSYDGFLPGDDASGIDTAPTCTVEPPYTPGKHAITCTGGEDDRYAFEYVDGTLSVGKATLKVTAADKSITYGQQPGELTYSYDGFVGDDGPAGIDKAPTCTVQAGPYVVGEYKVSCGGAEDDWYDFTYADGTLTVDKATLTVTADDQTKTYGTPNPELTFKYSGFVGDEGKSVLTKEPTCSTTATALSSVAGSPYTITCAGGEDDNYAFTYADGKLTVTPADALVNYIGETVFVTSGSSSSTAQVTLTATLQAVDEDYPLGAATVNFVDETTGKVLAANVPVTPVAGQTNVGTANAVVTLSSGQYGAEAYIVQVMATGNYDNAGQPDADKTATVVVMKPAAMNQTTGGGAFVPMAPAGTYAGVPNENVTFSIGMTYTSKGTNLQGKIVLTIPQPDGSLVYVKSNSISSMKVASTTAGKTSTIYTKASVFKVKNGVVTTIDGNVTLRVDAVDNGGPSTSTQDEVGFTVLSTKNSALYYSNRWVLSGGVWKTLTQQVKPLSVGIS